MLHRGRRDNGRPNSGTGPVIAMVRDVRIARDFIIRERPDVVIAVANAARLSAACTWSLSMLPGGVVEDSVLAEFGRTLEPVGCLMGLCDWRLIVALLSSFVAKENTVAVLGILYGTPLLDIKPYIPEFDAADDVLVGWYGLRSKA